MRRPSDFHPDLTDERLGILAGISAATALRVRTGASKFSMAQSLGLTRYCETLQAYVAASKALDWLDVHADGLAYHLSVGSAVLRVDKLDGNLPLIPLRRAGPSGNLCLPGIELPNQYLRLEVDVYARAREAMLLLVTAASTDSAPESEHRRWAIEIAPVTDELMLAWHALAPREGMRSSPSAPSTRIDAIADPVPPAEFTLRRNEKGSKDEEA